MARQGEKGDARMLKKKAECGTTRGVTRHRDVKIKPECGQTRGERRRKDIKEHGRLR